MEFLSIYILPIVLIALAYFISSVGSKWKNALQEIINIVKLYQAGISVGSDGGKELTAAEKSGLLKAIFKLLLAVIKLIVPVPFWR